VPEISNARIGIIGLGYVGLPLAVAFAGHFPTVGYDLSQRRIDELKAGHDSTAEIAPEALKAADRLTLSADPQALEGCNTYIVTVPTPIDGYKRPDLTPLLSASELLGRLVRPGDVVIYESTVYPGATEEDCLPVIERLSGLTYNTDFFAGYSPERINPGDKDRSFATIQKVTSGSTPEIADYVDTLYRTVVKAGTHKAPSIRVAEAAKVIENTQRDVNIALINEFALIFDRMGISTLDVLEAAGTKWNFMPFRPGLVGGHCIGVDPYYLASKAQSLGYYPEIVLAGRRINDGMGEYVGQRLLRAMMRTGQLAEGARVLILGATFKENCPDIRNTRVTDIAHFLEGFGLSVDIHDPWIPEEEAQAHLGIALTDPETAAYSGVIIAVAHNEFRDLGPQAIQGFGRPGAPVIDLKGIFHKDPAAQALGFESL
jgi:UDP-N-acetyl-D-galactosamine dehydrogenase